MNFQNILITGANRGLGFEFVRQLLALNPAPKNVIATTRKFSDDLNQLKLRNSNLHILIYNATNFESYSDFSKQVQSIIGSNGLDLLINNAGIYSGGTLELVTPQDILHNIEVNAVAPLELTRVLLPLLKASAVKRRKTIVVNVSSMAGSIGNDASNGAAISYPFRASKAALNMLSKTLSIDLKSENIIVLAIHPGWVQTDMGSSKAPLAPQTSVGGILDVLAKTDLQQSGGFLNWQGKVLPW